MSYPHIPLHVLAIDCCEHTLAALGNLPMMRFTSIASQDKTQIENKHERQIGLIVIGVARYPVRRLFISQLRRVYPNVPVLILRREEECAGEGAECIRGEFVLSDQSDSVDLDLVKRIRRMLPFENCEHTRKGYNFDIIRQVFRIIITEYSDPHLALEDVAKGLPMSPKQLSRILNKEVGISFRQLLRNMRIEEAKRMIASRQYSVKEIALRTGFTDTHYFSRSFKELTGVTASEYRARSEIFG